MAVWHGDGASMSMSSGEIPEEEGEEVEPAHAILFPWFSEALGIVVFFLLTRYLRMLPFTAVMFILGTLMGVGAVRLELSDQLTASIAQWDRIDSEVLLLVFLPGLIFRDAFGLNVHLFKVSFWQCLLLAFPMVLAGTALTALIGYFLFPFGWSFNLAMTFGSILSATDPVAVNALLNEVGAPPRLKMHISGESLLNDGSAMVFYSIFSAMFLAELTTNPPLGQTVNVKQGFAMFFQMSLGGALIGIAFGMALVAILYLLRRKLEPEENVLQVASTITVAYLTYYVADAVCATSGVIAVVMCGVTTHAFGSPLLNDEELMESFWELVEHLLNTVLFTLGGVVWGAVIANSNARNGLFGPTEWGYLICLYVLVMIMRFVLVAAFYPLISRMGLGSKWQEAVFLSYGGLRGAVGISLAIALDNKVWGATQDAQYRAFTTQLFGMVGGIAFLTLVINGTTSGPLLLKLGLADSTEVRERIVAFYRKPYAEYMLDALMTLLADRRFRNVDFAVVRYHVPCFKHVTEKDVELAVRRNKEMVPVGSYTEPNLENLLPYLMRLTSRFEQGEDLSDFDDEDEEYNDETSEIEEKAKETTVKAGSEDTSNGETSAKDANSPSDEPKQTTIQLPPPTNPSSPKTTTTSPSSSNDPSTHLRAQELRFMFLALLRYAYQTQVQEGALNGRLGFIAYELFQSLEFCADSVSDGSPLNDWETTGIVGRRWPDKVANWIQKGVLVVCKGKQNKSNPSNAATAAAAATNVRPTKTVVPTEDQARVDQIHKCLAFIEAHRVARIKLRAEFQNAPPDLTEALDIVLEESRAQVKKAVAVQKTVDEREVQLIVSHLLCTVLLNKAASYIENLVKTGMLKEREGGEFMEEIEASLDGLEGCKHGTHPGQLSERTKRHMYQSSLEESGGVDKIVDALKKGETETEPEPEQEQEEER